MGYKVTITYEIETGPSAKPPSIQQIQEGIKDKTRYLGYGANPHWRIKDESVRVRVKRKWR